MSTGGFGQLHIYQLAHTLAVDIHKLTMGLSKFELYEEGSQIRRSVKRISASIVEGYALRIYKAKYINYLMRAYGSAQETLEHLDLLKDTGSLTDESIYQSCREKVIILNKSLFRFIQGVQQQHERPDSLREEQEEYTCNSELFNPSQESFNDHLWNIASQMLDEDNEATKLTEELSEYGPNSESQIPNPNEAIIFTEELSEYSPNPKSQISNPDETITLTEELSAYSPNPKSQILTRLSQ